MSAKAPRIYELTKSRALSFRQCAKKLYLEVHRPELLQIDAAQQRVFDTGHAVGQTARELYGTGEVIDIRTGAAQAVARTRQLLESGSQQPIYEAAFLHDGVLVLADIVIPEGQRLRVIEVKSSTSVKETNLFDCAVQSWVMAGAGYPPSSLSIAHINTDFVYRGDGDYHGLFTEVPMDEQLRSLLPSVPGLIHAAKTTLRGPEPSVAMGPHCSDPYACPLQSHCEGPATDFPVRTLPRIGKKRWTLEREGYRDIRDIPEGRLNNPDHIRVWRAARTGASEFDAAAAEIIRGLQFPRFYLDFETIQFAVPIWAGTRPYEQLPFQWACKIERTLDAATLDHAEFLDLSGSPPMRACAEDMLKMLGSEGPIIVYSGFEAKVIRALAQRFSDLSTPLTALLSRLVDLLPIARQHYYHPRMAGSWSIKNVLPTVAADLDYGSLDEVRDGGGAQAAYLEAIQTTDSERKAQLRNRLLKYCALDAEAMVRVAGFLSGKK